VFVHRARDRSALNGETVEAAVLSGRLGIAAETAATTEELYSSTRHSQLSRLR
jgi:hypothetical protein